jgi:hypothetical protein
MTLLAAVCALVLGLLLAGCGYTSTAAQNPGGADGGTSTAGGSGPIAGTSVRPCVGPYADVGVEGQPALTLSDSSSDKTGSAHVGQLVQIQLPGDWHWTLGRTPTTLTATQNAGSYDENRQLCFWNFKASAAGTTTLQFTGTPRCEGPNQPCPTIARVESFTITVS